MNMDRKFERLVTNITKLGIVENVVRSMIFDIPEMNEHRDSILLEVVRLSRKLEIEFDQTAKDSK